ncbi:uncharacterized protein IL334_005019 [Kwoniella shivajii]|uniref:Uncharacterized protein n=1 Tax=Kwoniella shivajii TaxID=564305 RepID=A0ABZ1D3W3_9TREE|nr:hypothetical protein IL334_005019 [Kwoniella shivajii]
MFDSSTTAKDDTIDAPKIYSYVATFEPRDRHRQIESIIEGSLEHPGRIGLRGTGSAGVFMGTWNSTDYSRVTITPISSKNAFNHDSQGSNLDDQPFTVNAKTEISRLSHIQTKPCQRFDTSSFDHATLEYTDDASYTQLKDWINQETFRFDSTENLRDENIRLQQQDHLTYKSVPVTMHLYNRRTKGTTKYVDTLKNWRVRWCEATITLGGGVQTLEGTPTPGDIDSKAGDTRIQTLPGREKKSVRFSMDDLIEEKA